MPDSIPSSAMRAIVRAATSYIGAWHPAAEELLLMIAAHESKLGKYSRQVNGPALGWWQMEPATFNDVMSNVIPRKPFWKAQLALLAGKQTPSADDMVMQHAYACAVARLQIWRRPEPLPQAGDVDGLAAYAKKFWNTPLGAATVDNYRDAYKALVL